MNVTMKSKGKSINANDVLAKPPTALTVPVRAIADAGESIVLGFRQNMLEMGKTGRVDTGAGLGTDFIILQWGGRSAVLRGSEILRAWVTTFAPQDAERFPAEISALSAAKKALDAR